MRMFEVFDVENKKQISVISAAHGFNEFYVVVLPPVLPLLVADFGIRSGQAGFLVTVFFSMYAVFQLPAGMLADKFGQMRLLFVGMVVLLIGIFLVAIANSYKMLIMAQLLAGIGGSTYPPEGMSLISELETINTERRAMGIHGFGGMICVSVAPVLIGGIASLADWRIALLVACVLGGIATAVICFAFSDRVQNGL